AQFPMLKLWFADFAAQVLALGLIIARGRIPDLLSIVLAHALLIGGMVLLLVGLERYVGVHRRQTANLLMFGLFIAAQTFLTYGYPNASLRTAVLNLAVGLYSARAAWLLLRTVGQPLRQVTTMTGVAFLLLVLICSVRVVYSLATFAPGGAFRPTGADSLQLLVEQVFVLLLTFSLTLLVNRRLHLELETDIARRRIVEERFRAAFRSVPDPIIIVDFKSGVIEEVNARFETATGFSRDEVIGKTTADLGLWVDIDLRQHYFDIVGLTGLLRSLQARLRRKDGVEFDAEVSGEVMSAAGQLTILTVFHDITDRRLAEQRLVELSTLDPLTGLLNVRAFHDHAIARMSHISEGECSVVFMDVDSLKAINDEYGHAVGDETIVRLARVLRESFRESDIIGRLGGDEFGVLCVTREPGDEAILARLAESLDRANAGRELMPFLDVSVGIASCDCRGGQAALNEAIRQADHAMYEMKREHRHQAEDSA
ncbi:MAG TPA: sensor domain-containing diguanylate cyclase, partial [Coriobacteriia bacterium]|nr:sensor domain-containing diguanylate cyclase [Coriobacteriia bacterium]